MIFFHHTPVYHSFFGVFDLLKPHFSQDLYDLAAAICSERESEEADMQSMGQTDGTFFEP